MANLTKIEAIKKTRPVRLLDGIVLLALIAAILLPYFLIFRTGDAQNVRVTIDGSKAYEFSLEGDKKYDIAGHLTLCIKDGVVWVEDADCPDKRCMLQKIRYVNESIICPPLKIVITISGFSPDIYLP